MMGGNILFVRGEKSNEQLEERVQAVANPDEIDINDNDDADDDDENEEEEVAAGSSASWQILENGDCEHGYSQRSVWKLEKRRRFRL